MMRDWLGIGRGATGLGATGGAEKPHGAFAAEVRRNKIWYRGDGAELAQFYGLHDDGLGNRSFWAASGNNAAIRKLHSGLPALIVDCVADLAVNDLVGIKLDSDETQAVWDAIAAENGFVRLLAKAVRDAAALGDGAFKISYDKAVSAYPIIEFFGAEEVRFVHSRGRVTHVVFMRGIVSESDGRYYTLEEIYSRTGIDYRLLDDKGREVDLQTAAEFAEFAELTELTSITHNLGINLAIPLLFDENPRHKGRGRSIFDAKIGAFDALDEVLSQWIDALRDGRVQKYIPIGMLPRNPHNGRVMGLSAFESRFVQTEMDMAEGADNSIKVVQPAIDTAALEASCANYLNFALQGIIAPATLGIDLKRRDNAEAQREKEKATLYTRGKLIGVLREVVARVAQAAVAAHFALTDRVLTDCIATVEFGEYAAPDFGSQIETVGKGRQMGIISIENAVEQLYGGTWTAEQKAEEVERIRK